MRCRMLPHLGRDQHLATHVAALFSARLLVLHLHLETMNFNEPSSLGLDSGFEAIILATMVETNRLFK
jgi:hypothetical protein